MKRKQRRYTTEQEIIDAIVRVKAHQLKLITQAESCENESALLKINAKVRRIEDATLSRLKQCLAAFRTGLLSITDDPAVVA